MKKLALFLFGVFSLVAVGVSASTVSDNNNDDYCDPVPCVTDTVCNPAPCAPVVCAPDTVCNPAPCCN